jgi:hypothetical protein
VDLSPKHLQDAMEVRPFDQTGCAIIRACMKGYLKSPTTGCDGEALEAFRLGCTRLKALGRRRPQHVAQSCRGCVSLEGGNFGAELGPGLLG